MSYKELAHSLIDQIPESKMYYIVTYLQGAAVPEEMPNAETSLPVKNKDHNLSGNYSGYKECHIEPDWLLIYKQTDNELKLDRTGTHAICSGYSQKKRRMRYCICLSFCLCDLYACCLFIQNIVLCTGNTQNKCNILLSYHSATGSSIPPFASRQTLNYAPFPSSVLPTIVQNRLPDSI